MEMPVQAKIGVALLSISVVADAAVILSGIPSSLFLIWLRSAQIVNLVVPIAPLVLRLVLITLIWNRKGWARIIFGLLTLVGVVAIPFLPTTTQGYWILVLSLLCQVAGLAWLFLRPSAAWFKKTKPANG